MAIFTRRRFRIAGVALIAFIISLPLWMQFNGIIVALQASRIAGDRPYCIQYAGPDAFSYTAATSLSELSAFNMRARLVFGGSGGPFAGNNHAILVLDEPRAYMNWSYWHENFRPEALNHKTFDKPGRDYLRPKLVCAPQRNFVRTLKFM